MPARDAEPGHRLSVLVEHLEDGTLLLCFGLDQEPPRTDDGCDFLLQRTFGQIPREAHGAGHSDGETIAPGDRLPFHRGCAVRASPREARARPTNASIERVQDAEPLPGD